MDKLQHIDKILQESVAQNSYASVTNSDWLIVEKKLRQRRNRIYAVWFFLALFLSVGTISIFLHQNSDITTQTVSNNETIQIQPESNTDYDHNDIVGELPLDNNSNTAVDVPSENNTSDINSSSANSPSNLLSERYADNNQGSDLNTPIQKPNDLGDIGTNTTDLNKDLELLEVGTPEDAVNDDVINLSDKKDPTATTTPQIPSTTTNTGPKDKHNKGYWEVGIDVTPSLSNKTIAVNPALQGLIHKDYMKIIENGESGAFATTYGAKALYHVNSKWFVATGLYRTEKSEYLRHDYMITDGPDVVDNEIQGYFALGPLAQEHVQVNSSNSYHFIEIPLNVGYKLPVSRNFEVRPQVGVSYLGMINKSGAKVDYTYLDLVDLKDITYFNNSNLAGNAKLGGYLIAGNWVFGAEPQASLNLTSFSSDQSAISIKPYSYGLTLSTAYTFKNK